MAKDSRQAGIGRLGGLALAAKHDPRQYTKAARQAFRDRFLEEVDPDGSLRRSDPAEASRRAEAARRLFYARLAFASVDARRKKAQLAKRQRAQSEPEADP